jgi:mono/diheme cytochrome c family protein
MTRTLRPRAKLIAGAAFVIGVLATMTGCDLQEDADIDRGRAIFTQKCGTCHALAEAGSTVNIGPNLDEAFAEARENGMDQDTIEGVVTDQVQIPRPASPEDTAIYMPEDIVEGQDLEDVAAYVGRYAGVPGIEPPTISEFFIGTCGGCHTFGAAGTAGDIGPDLDQTLQGQSPEQIRESIENPDAQSTPGFPTGVMPSFSTLPPEQLDALIQFLQGMDAGAGGGAKQPAKGG